MADLGRARRPHTKRLGAVLLLLAYEIDRLGAVVDRLTRQVR